METTNLYWSVLELSKLGKRMSIRQQALATAQVYVRRFYHKVEIRKTNPYLILATALYLACKMEECPQHIRAIVHESRQLWSGKYLLLLSPTGFNWPYQGSLGRRMLQSWVSANSFSSRKLIRKWLFTIRIGVSQNFGELSTWARMIFLWGGPLSMTIIWRICHYSMPHMWLQLQLVSLLWRWNRMLLDYRHRVL